MNKKKILGVIISVGDVTVTALSKYTLLPKETVEKIVNQLIKEGKISYD